MPFHDMSLDKCGTAMYIQRNRSTSHKRARSPHRYVPRRGEMAQRVPHIYQAHELRGCDDMGQIVSYSSAVLTWFFDTLFIATRYVQQLWWRHVYYKSGFVKLSRRSEHCERNQQRTIDFLTHSFSSVVRSPNSLSGTVIRSLKHRSLATNSTAASRDSENHDDKDVHSRVLLSRNACLPKLWPPRDAQSVVPRCVHRFAKAQKIPVAASV